MAHKAKKKKKSITRFAQSSYVNRDLASNADSCSANHSCIELYGSLPSMWSLKTRVSWPNSL